MARVAPRVPELSQLLCSKCGYIVDGISEQSNCPECGRPIAQSIDSDRVAPPWETSKHRLPAFIQTTVRIIFQPAIFYRTFTVRGSLESARRFARVHWWLCSFLYGLAAATHAIWFSYRVSPLAPDFPGGRWAMFAVMVPSFTGLIYLALDGLTRLAGKLTSVEATYRGLRLPYQIVLRGMYYHAAHYLPVAIAAIIVIEGYQLIQLIFESSLPFDSPMLYLYALCALVVVSAIYLFQTYWIGMRNMMYANR